MLTKDIVSKIHTLALDQNVTTSTFENRTKRRLPYGSHGTTMDLIYDHAIEKLNVRWNDCLQTMLAKPDPYFYVLLTPDIAYDWDDRNGWLEIFNASNQTSTVRPYQLDSRGVSVRKWLNSGVYEKRHCVTFFTFKQDHHNLYLNVALPLLVGLVFSPAYWALNVNYYGTRKSMQPARPSNAANFKTTASESSWPRPNLKLITRPNEDA